MQVWAQQLDGWGRRILPFLTTLLIILLTVLAGPLPNLASVMPLLPLMAVYYWAVYRPDLQRPTGLFVLGLVLDALAGVPLGLNVLGFLAVAQLVQSQRHIFADRSYPTLWLGFAVVVVGWQVAQWLLLSLFSWRSLPLGPLLVQSLFTLALFPACVRILILLQRHIVR